MQFTNRVSRSATLPVKLSDVKAHLAINWYDDDTRLTNLIWAAIDYLENAYNIALVSQQWTQTQASLFWENYRWLDNFMYGGFPYPMPEYPTHGHKIPLSHYPLVSFDSVTYFDPNNVQQTYATSNFILMQDSRYYSYIQALTTGTINIPTTYCRPDAWTFTFTAGYSTLPQGIQHAINVLVSSLNENREQEVIAATVAPVIMTVQNLMKPYIVETVL